MENWFKIEFIFTKNLHITPLELDQMEFYRVEYMIQSYEEFIKEEEKAYKKQQKENEMSFSKNKASPQFKMPKMDIPKMNVPKF